MDYRIFNVRTDVNACDYARGCTDTERESALKVDSGREIPCRTGESNPSQRRAGPTLYQLSYIPTHTRGVLCPSFLPSFVPSFDPTCLPACHLPPPPFYSSFLSSFLLTCLPGIAHSTVFHSINSPNNSPLSLSVLSVLFLPYWSFQLHMKVSLSPPIILCG